MINRIQEIITKPMIERTAGEELAGLGVIAAFLFLLYIIGNICYRIENRIRKKKENRK